MSLHKFVHQAISYAPDPITGTVGGAIGGGLVGIDSLSDGQTLKALSEDSLKKYNFCLSHETQESHFD